MAMSSSLLLSSINKTILNKINHYYRGLNYGNFRNHDSSKVTEKDVPEIMSFKEHFHSKFVVTLKQV
jgi:hypothetical protein